MGLNYNPGNYAINRYFQNADTKIEREKANTSAIANYMRKNKNFPTLNPGEEWKITYYRNKAILAITIFHFLFTNDDGVLTKKEVKLIDKYLKLHKIFFTEEDNIYFATMPTPYPKENLLKYIQDNKMQKNIFNDAIRDVKATIKKDFTYRNILTRLSEYMSQFID
ncbi:MAG: hypothetical protein AB7U79_08595 [Candidatus Izemoplasmatales bacterium]